MRPFQLLPAAAVLAVFATAAPPDPAFSERGKLLFSDDFSAATMKPGWVGQPGKWEIVNGAAMISERTEDKHAAVRRHPLQYHDAIFEFSFQFNGAKMLALSINNKGGHVCRLQISPTGMVLQTDKPNAKSDLKPVRLAAVQFPVEPGKWHKVVVEVRGKRMTAQMDGKQTLTGENALVDVDKTDFGFPIGGVSALLDNVRVFDVKR
jgi:hypothetical protein